MKVLTLSSITLALSLIFSSCSKDLGSGVTSESTSSLQGPTIANNAVTNNKKPVLTPTQSPSPVKKGNTVTISYSATDVASGASLQCGRIKIYQLIAGSWVEVASGNAPSASFSFVPQSADDCAYKFRAGFDPGGATQCRGAYSGVDYLTQQDFCADVIEPCVDVFTINGESTAIDLNNGLFEFTITYTLTSPVDVDGIKFQGGATAGGKTGHAITDVGQFTYVNINNNNTVLKWEGSLKACTPKVLTFKYTRNFSCPADGALVTGDWTASKGEVLLGSIDKLPYSCN